MLIYTSLENENHHIRMIMAGGDGSLMGLVNKAKEAGCDINTLVTCVLPYGTGNDLARCLNWGGSEGELKIYKSLPKLINEICLNAEIKELNIWTVLIKFRHGGTTFDVDSKRKRSYIARNETFFERFMINYFSFGEDARVGTGFEKNRTKHRCCNTLVYGAVGCFNFCCCCRRPESITDQILEVRSYKASKSLQEQGVPPMPEVANPMIMEETKDQMEPMLNRNSTNGEILFTTKAKDPDNLHIKGKPVTFCAMNIPSMMGGRANPWIQAAGRMAINNPYTQNPPKDYNTPKKMEKQLNFTKQDPTDGVLEFVTFRNMFEMTFLKRGQRLIQDEGPIEFKFKERVSLYSDHLCFTIGGRHFHLLLDRRGIL